MIEEKSHGCYEESLMKDEDFQEEEIWAVGKEREESNHLKVNKSQKLKRYPTTSSYAAWTSIDGAGAPRTTSKGSRVHQQQQSSAPMRIPDWSKIYMEKSMGSSNDDNGNGFVDDDDNDEMMPPHEYINRRVATSQIAPFSMCEGVGRTLKGRDLSKVRNAILTKTGFLE